MPDAAYAILTGRQAGYVIIRMIDGVAVTVVYDMDGQFRPGGDARATSMAAAKADGVDRYGRDLHNWFRISSGEPDPLAYAMAHRERSGS